MSFIREIWAADKLTFWSLAFIVAWFLVGLLLATVRVVLQTRRISRLLRRGRRFAGSPEEAQLAAHEWVRAVPGLMVPIDAYERWWRSALVAGRGAAIGTKTLEDFLAPMDLLPSWNRAIAGVWPGILVALGILGTFMGLVQGLPAISDPGAVTSGAEFSGFVQEITKSLGLAFWTSILGIAFSVLFLIIDRSCVSHLEDAVHRLSRYLANVFPTISPEEAMRLRMERMEDLSACVKNMGVDLAQSLANYMGPAISTALQAELAPVVASIQDSVGRLVEFSTDRQTDAVRGLVDGFVANMNAAVGDQFEQLRQVITKTVAVQEEIGDGIHRFSLQLSATAQSQTALIERTTKLNQGITGIVERLDGIVRDLSSAADGFGDFAAALGESAQALVASNEKALSAQEQLRAQLEADRVSMADAHDLLAASWRSAIEEANRAIGSTQAAVHQISEAAREVGQGVGDQLVNALSTFDSALGEVIGRFSGTLAQVDASVGELPPTALAMRDTISTLNGHAGTLAKSTATLEDLVRNQLTVFGKDTAAAASHLHGVMQVVMRAAQNDIQNQKTLIEAAESLRGTLITFGNKVEDLQSVAALLLQATQSMRVLPVDITTGGRLS
jgi:prophage DNA circulation protein